MKTDPVIIVSLFDPSKPVTPDELKDFTTNLAEKVNDEEVMKRILVTPLRIDQIKTFDPTGLKS